MTSDVLRLTVLLDCLFMICVAACLLIDRSHSLTTACGAATMIMAGFNLILFATTRE